MILAWPLLIVVVVVAVKMYVMLSLIRQKGDMDAFDFALTANSCNSKLKQERIRKQGEVTKIS